MKHVSPTRSAKPVMEFPNLVRYLNRHLFLQVFLHVCKAQVCVLTYLILKHRDKTLVAILFVLFSGTADSDVKCEQCPDGTFSDAVSNTDRCRPHTK